MNFEDTALFKDVGPATRDMIARDLKKYYKTGDKILVEGHGARNLVLLLAGEARVEANGTYLITRRAGEIIGEQSILEGTQASATVIAQGMVEALVIPEKVVQKLLSDATFALNLAKIVSGKLRQATSDRSHRYRQQEQLFGEFSAHVSPEVAAQLLSSGEAYGKPKFINTTLLMADIRNFSEISGRMQPLEIEAQLTPYLDKMVEVIHRHGGFVDKFIGDAVLAVWGAFPGSDENASAALECAKEMVTSSASMTFGGQSIKIGVGLNSGKVFAGNVGGEGKRQFTVLGSPVNLVARLETQCKDLHTEIVVGEDFFSQLPESAAKHFERRPGVHMKGFKTQSVYAWRNDTTHAGGQQ